jgi:hypothetical protein
LVPEKTGMRAVSRFRRACHRALYVVAGTLKVCCWQHCLIVEYTLNLLVVDPSITPFFCHCLVIIRSVLMFLVGAEKDHSDQCEQLIRGQLSSSTKLDVVRTNNLNSLDALCENIAGRCAVHSPSGILIVAHAAGKEHSGVQRESRNGCVCLYCTMLCVYHV